MKTFVLYAAATCIFMLLNALTGLASGAAKVVLASSKKGEMSDIGAVATIAAFLSFIVCLVVMRVYIIGQALLQMGF